MFCYSNEYFFVFTGGTGGVNPEGVVVAGVRTGVVFTSTDGGGGVNCC